MSLLALSDITIRYGRLTAVRDLSLRLGEGEILFITGPNGAGKSSLMRAIAGVTPPAAGRIDFGGAEITGRAPEEIARMGLSMVPDLRHAGDDQHDLCQLGKRHLGHQFGRGHPDCPHDLALSNWRHCRGVHRLGPCDLAPWAGAARGAR
ncbi:MAG: ATP-binding cassette domain-containing protein [Sphingomonadales bacterium]|nr:ATP-binding cassette domain-containing protein [Sphingomonadales bacterium]